VQIDIISQTMFGILHIDPAHFPNERGKKEFLLRFLKDRKRWIHWLFEAKKRFGLRILNYVVTSNHIHLLVIDSGRDVIPKSIQLVAGRTAPLIWEMSGGGTFLIATLEPIYYHLLGN